MDLTSVHHNTYKLRIILLYWIVSIKVIMDKVYFVANAECQKEDYWDVE